MAALQNDIYIGSVAQPLYHYSNRSIEMGTPSGLFSVDTIGNELSIDTFSLSIRWRFDTELIYAPKGKDGYLDTNDKLYRTAGQYYNFIPRNSDALVDANGAYFRSWGGKNAKDYLSELEYGTPVFWYVTNSFFTKGYLKSVERIGKYEWKLTCISGVGLLDTQYHVGGLYNGETVYQIAQSIIGGAFSFTMASDVKATEVYGHLPYDTARNNLHRLLFSCGASLVRNNASTDYSIKFINAGSPVSVPQSRIAMGGSVNTQLPTNVVEVTEHAYAAYETDEEQTLYDNTRSGMTTAIDTIVVFQDPMHDIEASGNLTIAESGVNYAIVNGVGVLTGKKYTHTERVVTLGSGTPPRTKRVTDNHLISFINSNNVARRILNYYASARTIKSKIILNNEKCGNNLSITDMFGDSTTAFLEKMTVLVTSVKGANCELVEGFVPGHYGNNYANRVFISASGTWTVPSGVTRIRLVLIGGGQGGQGGYSGAAGMGGYKDYGGDMSDSSGESAGGWYYKYVFYYNGNQPAALGGNGGNGGSGGKVIVLDVDVTEGEVVTFSIGTGGTGGTGGVGSSDKRNAAGTIGSDGSDTTATSTSIGELSSANGSNEYGYTDAITGETFGVAGNTGTKGGNGGQTDTNSLYADGGYSGMAGADVGGYAGGAGGGAYNYSSSHATRGASGGGGGGAAVGANGTSGTAGARSGSWGLQGGSGGTGATALSPAKSSYGNGGTGGNGGGGGGNAGGASAWDEYDTPSYQPLAGNGGNGGSGSVGGEGGDGCVIILY